MQKLLMEVLVLFLLLIVSVLVAPFLVLMIVPSILDRLWLLRTSKRRLQEEADAYRAADVLGGKVVVVTPMMVLDVVAKIPMIGWPFVVLKWLFESASMRAEQRAFVVTGVCGGNNFKLVWDHGNKRTLITFSAPVFDCEGPKSFVKVASGHYLYAAEPAVDAAAKAKLDGISPGWRLWCQKKYDMDGKPVNSVTFSSGAPLSGEVSAAVVRLLSGQIKKLSRKRPAK